MEIESLVLDSLLAHVAIMDSNGLILYSNTAWKSFENQKVQIKRPNVGSRYFETLQKAVELGNDYALKILLGINKIFRGDTELFTLKYPVNRESETFWYNLTVRPHDEPSHFIMIHEDITASVSKDRMLNEHQNRYQVQFEQSLDGILITDTNGHVLDANPAASKLLGWDLDELIGCRRNQIVDTSDPDYIEALANRKDTGTYHLETNMICKNGDKLPVEITSKAYRNKSGQLRAIANFRDISRRKMIEKELLKNKNFTESVLNSIPGVFLVIDPKGNLIRWNDYMTADLGYTDEELAQKNALDFIDPNERATFQEKIEKCIEEGELSVETKVRSKYGKLKDYFFFAKPFKEDGKNYLVGVGIDITESKQAERENHKTQLMLEQLFENAPIGITIVDTDNNIQRVNKSFENIFEYAQEDILDHNINELIVPQGQIKEAKSLSLVTQKGALQYESKRLTKNGKEVPVLIGSAPVNYRDETIAIYGMYVDISAQHNYRKKIEHALKEKEKLLAELHHRVKNNLALINSLLELQLFDSDESKLNSELTDIKNRILTIASIHEVLYREGNLTNISFENFLREFISTSNIQGQIISKTVSLDNNINETPLDIDQSIPSGLLINELLSLIYKSNKGNKPQNICLNLREYGQQIHLIIEGDHMLDHPEEVKKEQSLNMLLINTLITQLDGTLLWPTANDNYQKFECFFTRMDGNGPAREILAQSEV